MHLPFPHRAPSFHSVFPARVRASILCAVLLAAFCLLPRPGLAQDADSVSQAKAGGPPCAREDAAPGPTPLDFLVVLPGAPESPEEAVQAVDGLAEFLARKTGRSVQGGFTNDSERAVDLLEREPPRWGVVSLGFYLQYAGRLKMTPVASTLPGGEKGDIWRVLTAPEYSDRELAGDFAGSMLFERETAACLLLRGRNGGIVGFRGERAPLMALRDLGGEGLAGVVLDNIQYEATAHLSYKDELNYKVLFEVPNLPAGPVVWFGEGAKGGDAETLVKALHAAASAKQARPAMELLRTSGFGPADKRLSGLLKECGQ
ncbi:substrate-binding domain-containing protein [Paucidesulfovibrio longus]|uniref:hypothetical protein n=1 Tax=Paucidesulfovibrio longus TaxID=889 RepID=UPI0003B62961|nr:hypothetical protein [Paucidesulfovibrio longus]